MHNLLQTPNRVGLQLQPANAVQGAGCARSLAARSPSQIKCVIRFAVKSFIIKENEVKACEN